MIEEFAPSILDWEVSTFKAKGKGVGRWERKKDEAESPVVSALSAPVASLGQGKGNERMV
ncbi:UNVERIFIED_CONTAM: hypothetical protein Sradi_5836800 [Sesamum radiatum]|uniref:Uncharacterized protein n=1 Tax=Sesamum radiatum TaxID=300843 RepID=A0AAW2KPU6_SESRA